MYLSEIINEIYIFKRFYMVLSEEEAKAISKKIKQPEIVVKCPRCGNVLRYQDRGASIAIICNTPRCICGGIRGI